MVDNRLLTFENLQPGDSTETIDFSALFPECVTFTGSFDVHLSTVKSFSALLNAIPTPGFLVDPAFSILFANTGCAKFDAEYLRIIGRPFGSLLPDADEAKTVRSVLETVFSSRKPQSLQATLEIGQSRIWGRMHFRSLRMGTERSVLILVEDLTHEKQQLLLNQRYADNLIKAREELEKSVTERTAELTQANEQLTREVAERKRVEESLRKAREELERRVEERTAELKESNARLLQEIAYRTEAEKALKKSEDKFRTIYQHSLDVIIVIDGSDGTIIGANRALESVLNYRISDVIGKNVSVLYPTNDIFGGSDPLDDIRPHGAIFEAQSVLRADGALVPMDLTATVIPWNGGTAVLATFRDVSDREAALEARRQSEERYRALFDQASNAILLEGENGEIVDANRAASCLTGYTHSELRTMKMADLIAHWGPFDHSRPEPEGQCAPFMETVVACRDGAEVPVGLNVTPLCTGGETILLAIAHDLRDRKRMENLTLAQRDLSTGLSAVSSLSEALRLCIETTSQVSGMDSAGIYLTNKDSGLDLAAHRGLSERFVANMAHLGPDFSLVHLVMKGTPIYACFTELGLSFPMSGETGESEVMAVIPIHDEGHVIACFIIASPIIEQVPIATRHALEVIAGQIGSAIARLRAEEALREAHQELEKRVEQRTKELVDANRRLELEIAQRISAEDHIRESLKEKDALLQEVHHRVKNNLQIISSLLALQRTHVTDRKTLGVLKDSQSRIRSMSFIHEHLYKSQDLARINFTEYIKDLVGALLQSYSEVGARVSLKLDLEPVFLGVGTALPCGLIINEVVSNCLKHAFSDGREGEIRVGMHRRVPIGYELTVADDGIGLPRDLDFRESQSLGLRLVTNLTELQLRGTLEVSSDPGTQVRILFEDRDQPGTGGTP